VYRRGDLEEGVSIEPTKLKNFQVNVKNLQNLAEMPRLLRDCQTSHKKNRKFNL
jgi:hypothetical protein